MSSSNADDHLYRPSPRRPFSLHSTPDTAYSSRPASPASTDFNVPQTPTALNPDDQTSPPPRSRSILNLTSSTLLGIYSRTGYQPDRDDSITTPWGTGAETPISRQSSQPDGSALGIDPSAWQDKSRRRRSSVLDTSAKRTRRHELVRRQSYKGRGFRKFWVPQLLRSVALGAVGYCYGLLISHLHDRQQLTPVKVDRIPHYSRPYLFFWSVVAIVLGSILPWLDHFWESEGPGDVSEEKELHGRAGQKREKEGQRRQGRTGRGPGWNDVVRSIGALVGIAFAIRRLPWQSTLQLSLTLALSNPAIWYLLDRTPPGFILSTTVAISGTALCLILSPDLIPPPSSPSSIKAGSSFASNITGASPTHAGLISNESIGVATWIASVLFIS